MVRYAMVVAAVLTTSTAFAQEGERAPGPLERAGVTGSIRTAYWLSTRDLDDERHAGAAALWLKAARPLGPRVSFLAEARIDGTGAPHATAGSADLREAFLDLRFGDLDLRLGRQIIAWGRADGINPTDNLTGEDLTLLAPDDDDRRTGSTAIRASYYLRGVSISGVWIPEFRASQVPLPTQPGLRVVSDTHAWPGTQWAVRVEQAGQRVDWSLSYFRGRDLLFDLIVDASAGAATPGVRLSHHDVKVAGGDVAFNAGRIGVRAEAAIVRTEDRHGADPFTKNPFLFAVAGGDRTFGEHLNVNVQYLYRYVFDFAPLRTDLDLFASGIAAQQAIVNSETRRHQHGASLRIGYKWLRETLEAELAAAGFFNPGGASIRPKVSYAVSDDWKVIAGAEIFRGASASIFGLMRANSTVFVETRWAW